MDLSDHLPSRSIIPLIHPLPVTPGEKVSCRIGSGAPSEDIPDLKDIQGDVIYLFSKRAENFIFFRIANPALFKAALTKFQPSNSYDTGSFVYELYEHRRNAFRAGIKPSVIKKAGYQIAFTRMGMNYLGIRSPTGDTRFDKRAMRDDKNMLGDQGPWDSEFDKKNADPVNGSANKDDPSALHGVITVVGSDATTCNQYSNDTKVLFGLSIQVVKTLEGRARPGTAAGHEHFGYEDGISQPALRKLSKPNPGQIEVNPGVIIMGYKGDPVFDDPSYTGGRPAWARGGTMMVFRKLEQDVPAFNAYLTKNGPRWREFAPPGCPKLTDKEGAELWGARLIGRWKSGAPVALCPYKDDPQLAVDPKRNNNFDYRVRGVPGVSPREHSALYCPFFTHTRKTVPRNLDPYIQQAFLESSMIVRGGLPYGPELQENPGAERGLLFVCYQSSLDAGFIQQTAFAGNDYFPTTSLVPQFHGVDTVLGGPPVGSAAVTRIKYDESPVVPPKSGDLVNLVATYNGNDIEVSGFAKVRPSGAVSPPGVPSEFFVTSHGGEYFFVPPISTLKKWASGIVSSG